MMVPSDYWDNIFNCNVCLTKFDYSNVQSIPITRKCGEVICDSCARKIVSMTCHFHKTDVFLEFGNMEVNTVILTLVRLSTPENTPYPSEIWEEDRHHYTNIIKNLNNIAKYLKYIVNEVKVANSVIKRFICLAKYSLLDAEGKSNFYNNASLLGESVLKEIFLMNCIGERPKDPLLWELCKPQRNSTDCYKIHDIEIIKMTLHNGFKITLEEWHCIFYDDPSHTGEVQSMVDKIFTPQFYMRSVSETFAYYKSTKQQDEADLLCRCIHLLAGSRRYRVSACSFTWQELEDITVALYVMMREMLKLLKMIEEKLPLENKRITTCLKNYMIQNAIVNPLENAVGVQSQGTVSIRSLSLPMKYKNKMCTKILQGMPCFRGNACHFAHSSEEKEFFSFTKFFNKRTVQRIEKSL